MKFMYIAVGLFVGFLVGYSVFVPSKKHQQQPEPAEYQLKIEDFQASMFIKTGPSGGKWYPVLGESSSRIKLFVPLRGFCIALFDDDTVGFVSHEFVGKRTIEQNK